MSNETLTVRIHRAACFYLAVHENIVRSKRPVNQTMFVHELQTLQDLKGNLQHLLWARTKTKQNKISNEPTCLQGRMETDEISYLHLQYLIVRNTNTVQ